MCVNLIGTMICGLHQGQRHPPRQKAGHMSALNRKSDFEKMLDRRVSTHASRGMRWRRGIFLLKRGLHRVRHGCPLMFSNQKHGAEDLS